MRAAFVLLLLALASGCASPAGETEPDADAEPSPSHPAASAVPHEMTMAPGETGGTDVWPFPGGDAVMQADVHGGAFFEFRMYIAECTMHVSGGPGLTSSLLGTMQEDCPGLPAGDLQVGWEVDGVVSGTVTFRQR